MLISPRTTIVLFCLALAVNATKLTAALISYEGFNYSEGQFASGASPGSGWNSNWWVSTTSPASYITTPSLSAPTGSHPTSGGHLEISPTGAGIGLSANIAYGTDFKYHMSEEGTVRYASMLVNKSNIAASGSEYIQLNIGSASGRTNWLMGMSSSETFFLRSYDTELRTSMAPGTHVQANQSYLMVSKLVTSATGNDMLYLNWYKGTDLVPTEEPVDWMFQMSVNNTHNTAATHMSLETGNAASTTFRMDEIRLGTTWAAVAPEPSKGLLLFASGACLLLVRRRVSSAA